MDSPLLFLMYVRPLVTMLQTNKEEDNNHHTQRNQSLQPLGWRLLCNMGCVRTILGFVKFSLYEMWVWQFRYISGRTS